MNVITDEVTLVRPVFSASRFKTCENALS